MKLRVSLRESYKLRSPPHGTNTQQRKNSYQANGSFSEPLAAGAVSIENARQALPRFIGATHRSLRHRQCPAADTALEKRDQTLCISAGISSFGQHLIVAGHFAFERKLALNPPDRRMEDEQSSK